MKAKERINQVINEVVNLGLNLTVDNVYSQSLFSPGGTLFNCDEQIKHEIYLRGELYNNGIWEIRRENGKEISISNGYTVSYAYLSSNGKLYFDRLIHPKYIDRIALKLAIKYIKPL